MYNYLKKIKNRARISIFPIQTTNRCEGCFTVWKRRVQRHVKILEMAFVDFYDFERILKIFLFSIASSVFISVL